MEYTKLESRANIVNEIRLCLYDREAQSGNLTLCVIVMITLFYYEILNKGQVNLDITYTVIIIVIHQLVLQGWGIVQEILRLNILTVVNIFSNYILALKSSNVYWYNLFLWTLHETHIMVKARIKLHVL